MNTTSPAFNDQLTPQDYLKKILTARVYDIAIETALEPADRLSQKLNNHVLLKREDQQPVRSFKLRGAYNKMSQLTQAQLACGVICASAGNHAQGVALSATKLGTKAIIVMPVTTPKLKIDAVKRLGGEVVLYGESYSDAYTYATQLQKEKHLTFIHPFDDPDVIAGQGTVAMEVLHQAQKFTRQPLDAIFIAVGGGGMIAGVACYVKMISPSTKVIAVQMNDSNAMMQSVQNNHRVALNEVGLFSDGTAVKLVGTETLRLTRELVDEFICVDTDSVCAAIKDIFIDTRAIVEPAGALALAGLKAYVQKHQVSDQNLVAVLCGANIDFDRLSFVADRAKMGEAREALFSVKIPETPGSLRQLCALTETIPNGPHNITEFNYRMNDAGEAQIFLGLSMQKAGDSRAIFDTLTSNCYQCIDLTHNELAKTHLRHMVGGHSSLAINERLLRFNFPERPGAMMKFLNNMQKNWNISLFHYRHQGGDYGNILVGMQVPVSDYPAFDQFLQDLQYTFVEETHNSAYQLFLR